MKKYSVSDKEKEKFISTISSTLEKEISIVFSYIYGSFLEGAFKDIDVAIFIDEGKITSFLRFELQMESLLNNAVGKFTFDVRILNGAPLSFRYEVIKSGRLILTKDEENRINFETSTLSNYFDFAPFRDTYLKEVLGIGSKPRPRVKTRGIGVPRIYSIHPALFYSARVHPRDKPRTFKK